MENYISVKDLLAELVRKAWIIILCTVVCAGGLTAVKYVKDVNYQKSVADSGETEVNTMSSFSDYEIDLLINHVSQMKYYYEQEKYMEESVYFNLDASKVYVSNVQFYVDARNSEQTDDVVAAYKNYITSGSISAQVSENLNGYGEDDIAELVVFSVADKEEEDTTTKEAKSAVIGITIYEADESKCKELTNAVMEVLDLFEKNLSQKGLSHELVLLENSIFQKNDSEMAAAQRAVILNHTTLRRNLTSLEEEMGETLVSVAKSMLDNESAGQVEEQVNEVAEIHVSISMKYLVLGATLGFLLSAGVIVVAYLFGGSIKTDDDVRVLFNLRKLGTFSIKEKNWFEKLADKIFFRNAMNSVEVEASILASKLSNLCELDKITEVALVGELGEEAEQQILNVSEKLETHNIRVHRVSNVNTNPDAFEVCRRVGKVVMLETLRKSKTGTVLGNIKLYKEQNIDVLGYVVFDK